MNNFFQALGERKWQLLEALGQHIYIAATALIIAAIIAVPLAILLSKKHGPAEFMLQLTGVLQTIPSLALLGLLIPLVGIGQVPAIIALVVYGLLPIFQNTYSGITSVDEELIEASDALGMTSKQKLFKVQLPLALPMIVAGLRISLVMIIGTATLAALIGAGGLGSFILLGIDRNNTSLILMGAITAAILALIFGYGIKLIEKLSIKKMAITLLVVLSVFLGISGYNLYEKNMVKEQVVIAGKLGSEPEILINMYKILIEDADPNVDVVLKPSFGKTSFLFNALKSGDVDIYPEYTGTAIETFLDRSEKERGKTPDDVYEISKEGLKKQYGMDYLKPMKFQNTYALAVRRVFSEEKGIKTISDLNSIRNLKAGLTLEFNDREDGYKGLEKLYGSSFDVVTMEPKLRYEAIGREEVDVIDAYSTDSELISKDLVILKDDKGLFPPYQGAPLMKEEFAKKNPKIVKALNYLAGKITEEEMQNMNYKVNVKGESPRQVAEEYLKSTSRNSLEGIEFPLCY